MNRPFHILLLAHRIVYMGQLPAVSFSGVHLGFQPGNAKWLTKAPQGTVGGISKKNNGAVTCYANINAVGYQLNV